MDTNTASDLELITKVKEEASSEAFSELQERHSGLFVNIVKKYTPSFLRISGVCCQDVMESKVDVLYNAVLSYEPNHGTQFNTWFGNKVDFYCKNTLNSIKLKKFESANPEQMENFIDNISAYIPEETFSEEAKIAFDLLNKLEDKRISKIFYMRCYLPKPKNSYNTIARELGMSVQGIINLFNKGKNYLRENDSLKDWMK